MAAHFEVPVWPADPDHAPVAWSLPKLERARDANGWASERKGLNYGKFLNPLDYHHYMYHFS